MKYTSVIFLLISSFFLIETTAEDRDEEDKYAPEGWFEVDKSLTCQPRSQSRTEITLKCGDIDNVIPSITSDGEFYELTFHIGKVQYITQHTATFAKTNMDVDVPLRYFSMSDIQKWASKLNLSTNNPF